MCNCKTEIEAALLERFKAKHPDAASHSATLEGKGDVYRATEKTA